MPEHVAITDPNIHECKGAAGASSNTVLQATGAGASTWAKIGTSNINTSSIFNTNKHWVTVDLPDVSTPDFVLVPIPVACTLTKITTILHTAITVANSTLTITNSVGPSTLGTIIITQAGSAEGDIDSLTPAINNTFAAGTFCKIATDGASTTVSKLTIFLEFTRTA